MLRPPVHAARTRRRRSSSSRTASAIVAADVRPAPPGSTTGTSSPTGPPQEVCDAVPRRGQRRRGEVPAAPTPSREARATDAATREGTGAVRITDVVHGRRRRRATVAGGQRRAGHLRGCTTTCNEPVEGPIFVRRLLHRERRCTWPARTAGAAGCGVGRCTEPGSRWRCGCPGCSLLPGGAYSVSAAVGQRTSLDQVYDRAPRRLPAARAATGHLPSARRDRSRSTASGRAPIAHEVDPGRRDGDRATRQASRERLRRGSARGAPAQLGPPAAGRLARAVGRPGVAAQRAARPRASPRSSEVGAGAAAGCAPGPPRYGSLAEVGPLPTGDRPGQSRLLVVVLDPSDAPAAGRRPTSIPPGSTSWWPPTPRRSSARCPGERPRRLPPARRPLPSRRHPGAAGGAGPRPAGRPRRLGRRRARSTAPHRPAVPALVVARPAADGELRRAAPSPSAGRSSSARRLRGPRGLRRRPVGPAPAHLARRERVGRIPGC